VDKVELLFKIMQRTLDTFVLHGPKRIKVDTSLYGQIAVAKFYPDREPPSVQGFETVVIHTSSKTFGGSLSPYVLKNEKGQLLENIWQFSKLNKSVVQQYTAVNPKNPDKIIWQHPAEFHMKDDQIQPEYWDWRKKGMNNWYAVRYPNGYEGRKGVLFSLWPKSPDLMNSRDEKDYDRLDYIEARKVIYYGEYARLAPRNAEFQKMQARMMRGKSFLICEIDGPDPDLSYPPYNRISRSNPGLIMDQATATLLMHDRKKPFGHGYTIACLLLDGANWFSRINDAGQLQHPKISP
jgi:hypothetical protein